jgi:hypothetical protein
MLWIFIYLYYGSLGEVPLRNVRKIKVQYLIDVCGALNLRFFGYRTISTIKQALNIT